MLKGHKCLKIKYGNTADINSNEQERHSGLTHEWVLYVCAPSKFVKSVTYKLHESFVQNTVTITDKEMMSDGKDDVFKLTQKGWGEFTVQIKVTLFNNDKLHFSHFLKLHETKRQNDVINKKVVSEKSDSVFFKGKYTIPSTAQNLKFVGEQDELKRIDKCIDYVLEEIERYL